MDTLYIIGNGFDLHHGLDTSYKNFRDNVVLKTPNLRKLLLDLYGDAINEDMWWSDFEAKLSDIDYNHLLNSDYGVAMGGMKVQNFLTGQLPPLFGKWIKSIKLKNAPEKQLDIDKDALFFTFNYSLVLEIIYEVNKDNIWHIHNSIEEVDKIIVGHDSDLNTLISNYNLYRGNKFEINKTPYDSVGYFTEGLAAVKEFNRGRCSDIVENKLTKWGYIDKQFKVKIPYQFSECGPFKGGLAYFKKKGLSCDVEGYINKKGEVVWQTTRSK